MKEKILQKISNPKNQWMLAEDIPDVYFHFCQIFLSAFVNNLEKTVGRNYEKILASFRGHNLKFYYDQEDSEGFSKHVFRLIEKNPAFGRKINRNIEMQSRKIKSFSRKIDPILIKNISTKDLLKLNNNLDILHTDLYTWGWLPNAVDMFHNNFTDHLKEILRKKVPEEKVNEALVVLSVSSRKSVLQEEYESFLRLVKLRQEKESNKKTNKALKKHLKKYFYLKYLWLGKEGVYDEKYYSGEINNFLKSGKNAKKILREEEKNFTKNIKKRKILIHALQLNRKERELFDVYADFAVTKLIRRDAQIFWAYKMGFFFSELKRRLGISETEARFILPQEINESLRKGKVEKRLKKELAKRSKYSLYYAEKNKEYIFTGKEAKRSEMRIEKTEAGSEEELVGQAACLGKTKGRVKIINLISDIKKMKKGDVLVSLMTNPDIVPAMKMAAAIVTEQGGITSHAAIVSRELRIPCIIGVKKATKILNDGDFVEVDARSGVIRIIKKTE